MVLYVTLQSFSITHTKFSRSFLKSNFASETRGSSLRGFWPQSPYGCRLLSCLYQGKVHTFESINSRNLLVDLSRYLSTSSQFGESLRVALSQANATSCQTFVVHLPFRSSAFSMRFTTSRLTHATQPYKTLLIISVTTLWEIVKDFVDNVLERQ